MSLNQEACSNEECFEDQKQDRDDQNARDVQNRVEAIFQAIRRQNDEEPTPVKTIDNIEKLSFDAMFAKDVIEEKTAIPDLSEKAEEKPKQSKVLYFPKLLKQEPELEKVANDPLPIVNDPLEDILVAQKPDPLSFRIRRKLILFSEYMAPRLKKAWQLSQRVSRFLAHYIGIYGLKALKIAYKVSCIIARLIYRIGHYLVMKYAPDVRSRRIIATQMAVYVFVIYSVMAFSSDGCSKLFDKLYLEMSSRGHEMALQETPNDVKTASLRTAIGK